MRDNGYVIVVDNATPVIITVPAGLMAKWKLISPVRYRRCVFVAASTVLNSLQC
jgi:hypothetical protein